MRPAIGRPPQRGLGGQKVRRSREELLRKEVHESGMCFVVQVAYEDAIARKLTYKATDVGKEHPVGLPDRRRPTGGRRPVGADTLRDRGELPAAPSDRGGEEAVPEPAGHPTPGTRVVEFDQELAAPRDEGKVADRTWLCISGEVCRKV